MLAIPGAKPGELWAAFEGVLVLPCLSLSGSRRKDKKSVHSALFPRHFSGLPCMVYFCFPSCLWYSLEKAQWGPRGWEPQGCWVLTVRSALVPSELWNQFSHDACPEVHSPEFTFFQSGTSSSLSPLLFLLSELSSQNLMRGNLKNYPAEYLFPSTYV